MIISLGDISANFRREAQSWVYQMAKYKTVRFFGYGNGRMFLGLILASKTAPDEEEWTKRRKDIHAVEEARKRYQCPYCGALAGHHHAVYSDTERALSHAIECDICQARGPATPDSEEKAWKLWNAMCDSPSEFLKRVMNAQS